MEKYFHLSFLNKRWYNKKKILLYFINIIFWERSCKGFGTYQIYRRCYEFFLRCNHHLGSYYFRLSVFQKWTFKEQQQWKSRTTWIYPCFSGVIYPSWSGSINSCWYYRYYSSSWTEWNNNTYCNSFYTYFYFLLFTKRDKRNNTAGVELYFCSNKKTECFRVWITINTFTRKLSVIFI